MNCSITQLYQSIASHFVSRKFRSTHIASLIALAMLALLLYACASGPDTGVRNAFEEGQVGSVAIAPFYSSSCFGMDADDYGDMTQHYEHAVYDALEVQGFRVVDSDELREHLAGLEQWELFEEGIRLRQALTAYFEPAPTGDRHPLEVRTLRELSSQGAIPVDSILFGEIVYHSQGTCRTNADDHTAYAELQVTSAAPADLPRPCVSSHFQAKLVDARTGETMWFNRTFVETHTGHLEAQTVRDTITRVVDNTIHADGGIQPLAPPDPDEVLADGPYDDRHSDSGAATTP